MPRFEPTTRRDASSALASDVENAMNDDVDESATKIAALRAAIDEGLAELDAGLGVETTRQALAAEVFREIDLAK